MMKWGKKLLVLAAVFFCSAMMLPLGVKAETSDEIQIKMTISDSDKDANGYLSDKDNHKWTIDFQSKPLKLSDFTGELTGLESVTAKLADDAGTITLKTTESLGVPGSKTQIKAGKLAEIFSVSKEGYVVEEKRSTKTVLNRYGYFEFSHSNFDIQNLSIDVFFKDTNGQYYAARYKVKFIFPAEYLVDSGGTPIFTLLDPMLSGNTIVEMADDVFTLKPKNYRVYNQKLTEKFNFQAGLAVGAKNCQSNDYSPNITVGSPDDLRSEQGYAFTIQAYDGTKKTYYIKVDMPWELTCPEAMKPYVTKVFDKDAQQTLNESTTSYRVNTLEAGDLITVVVVPPDGKLLSEVELETGKGTALSATITDDGESFSFTMPKDTVTLKTLKFNKDDTATRYAIHTNTAVKDHAEETADGCSVVVQRAGQAIGTAKEGSEVTLKAITTEGNRFYDYVFDHWETEDFTDLSEQDKKNATLTLTMPAKEVTVKAVFAHKGSQITIGTDNKQGASVRISRINVGSIITDQESMSDLYQPGTYSFELKNENLEGYEFLGWKDADGNLYDMTQNTDSITWRSYVSSTGKSYTGADVKVEANSEPITFIASFRAKTAGILTLTTNDDKMGKVSASVGEKAIQSGETVLYDGQTIALKAEPDTTKGYRFVKWQVTNPASDSGVTFVDETAAETTFVMPKQMNLTIQAVFEKNPNYKSQECTLSKVELLTKDGTLVKVASKDQSTFTIELSPNELAKADTAKLTDGSYLLRLTYSENAKAKKDGGYEDGTGTTTWADGISNPISAGGSGTFTITAEDENYTQKYTVAITYDDRPVLKASAVKRTSDKEATVQFTSSSTGAYYYAVVEQGAAKPDIDTSKVGVSFSSITKPVTITLSDLTAGAKDIYIIVKNDDKASEVKTSVPLKLTIPAYDAASVGYTIGVSQSPGGTVSVDKQTAKEGELVTVTVTPNTGKQIKSGGLVYSQSSAPYAVVKIDEKTKQFKMPAYDLTVSCTFVDASTVTEDGPSISAFVINGVSGVINNTAGVIDITLPYGTDLTALKPAITLKGASSVSPSSGTAVNLSAPVTYTVTGEDGSTKTYTVTAYTEAQPVSDKLWNSMLDSTGGSTDHSGKNTWWEKAKDIKKHDKDRYPKYW